jgi:alpha-amylase
MPLSKMLLAAATSSLLLFSCGNPTSSTTKEEKPSTDTVLLTDGHPAWIEQGNIYEVNVRQYTPEGTFRAFEKHLDRLKEMGVQTLWFMPIQPISKLDRKGELGSYYAVANYTAINPEFGNLEDWKSLVKSAQTKGFKVIIDWVANHTGADHSWLTTNKDFYVRDSVSGEAKFAFDWSDTRDLNFDTPLLTDSMIASMKYWLTETGIDGFRCDVAGEVPDAFWKKCIEELRKTKPGVFMLAEGDKPSLHEDGFDASYPWEMFSITKEIAAGKKNATYIDTVLKKIDESYPANAIKMWFTSNHDENSWNKADYGTMPGSVHAPFAVLSQTLVRGVPLIYSGQEAPFLDSISFFYKDTIDFGNFARASFYSTLLNLRKNNAALAANASFKKVDAGSPKQLYAFVRENEGKKVLVILNLSNKEATVKLTDNSLKGQPYNVFLMNNEDPTVEPWRLEPWGYVIYEY